MPWRRLALAGALVGLVVAGSAGSGFGGSLSLPAALAGQVGVGCPPTAAAPPASGLPLSLEQQIGHLLMAGVTTPTVDADLRRLIVDEHVRSVVLMGGAAEPPAQSLALTRELQALAQQTDGTGLLVATDQEGGRVQRLAA